MTYRYLTVKSLGETIVSVNLNRPEKRNALNTILMEELSSVFEELQHHLSRRVVIISGQGEVFCAGMDLQEAADPMLVEKMAQHVARMLTAIYTSKLVTIAAVQGDAVAGGAGLVAACDYALMAHEARIGFPETRRGLVAAQVATLLCRQMRMRDVRELLLLGELIDSQKAVSMGLVNKAVDKEVLMDEARHIADQVLLGAPEATRETKRLLDKLNPANFFKDLETALSFHHSARQSAEAKEGVSAFLEKRPPNWNM